MELINNSHLLQNQFKLGIEVNVIFVQSEDDLFLVFFALFFSIRLTSIFSVHMYI
jgi:hypothetical protein